MQQKCYKNHGETATKKNGCIATVLIACYVQFCSLNVMVPVSASIASTIASDSRL